MVLVKCFNEIQEILYLDRVIVLFSTGVDVIGFEGDATNLDVGLLPLLVTDAPYFK